MIARQVSFVLLAMIVVGIRSSYHQKAAAKSRVINMLSQQLEASTITKIPSGLCAVYKPKDWSSSDVVSKCKHILQHGGKDISGKKTKIKVGHGGTLDPMAEGVLVLGIGEGTKMLSEYLSGSKGYRAKALFGSEMDTLDSTGEVVETVDCSHINMEMLAQSLDAFRGEISQMPPMYSALKKDGKRLYELAREGIEVEREKRLVTVYKLELLQELTALPEFVFDLESSGGFYVRSLISDIAKSLNGVAHMTELTRTKQGLFTIEDCLLRDNWEMNALCNHTIKSSAKVGIDANKLKAAAVLVENMD